MSRRIITLLAAFMLVIPLMPAAAQDLDRADRALPESVENAQLSSPITRGGTTSASGVQIDDALVDATGTQTIIVRLSEPAVGESDDQSHAAQGLRQRAVENEQAQFRAGIRGAAPGAREITAVQGVLNAVFLEADAADVDAIAALPGVERIGLVGNYQLDLSETVPYIGASAVQSLGVDGSGISVAVLDSGIDYTHANLGGPGTLAAYDAAYADPASRDGLFPTADVVDGYDFVGEVWPGGPLSFDPDPIDFGGHGTHVADIIGGNGGVAPGVDLWAVKVCSAVSTACSGVALIAGMDFSVDPNGDGNTRDAVDIINMSLGSNYGQWFDDDLSTAVENASRMGVLTVSSAGNGGDEPYIQGTPSGAPTAISVAQTNVPSAGLQLIDVDGFGYPAVFQPWSVTPAGVLSGPVQYGDGAGGNLNGCAAFAAGSLTGKIVLVDRGACNFTLKISNISVAGGTAGIIGLIAPGAPFSGGDGGDRPIDIPGYMISQADSNAIKAQIGGPGIGTIDPANVLDLVGTMVGSSSRGPNFEDNTIKPDIGAPGASVSAQVGTGTGETPFGGTSGASPMVAGSAALLLDGYPAQLAPNEVKALLMNNADTTLLNDVLTGEPAPITRIGGGEVRVDAALAAPAAAWENSSRNASLSFGFVDVTDPITRIRRTVRVRNYSGSSLTYSITPTFQNANDTGVGVSVSAPSNVTVGPGRDATFTVTMTINGATLAAARGNSMNSGANGANPAPLTLDEVDGYLVLDAGTDVITMPWHVLPRASAKVLARDTTITGGGFPELFRLTNRGVGTAQNNAYSLLALSPNLPEGGQGEQSPTPDLAAVGINTFPVPAGFCSGVESFIWAFAVNTHERQTHAVSPGIYWFDLDTDQDGTPDYAVYNYDLAGLGSIGDGRNVTWAAPYVTYPTTIGTQSAFFFAEHATNSANTVLYICGEQIGLTGTDMLSTNVDIADVFAFDIYFGGPGDQIAGPITVTPLGEQYFGLTNDTPGLTSDNAGLAVYDFGPFPGNSPELGVLLLTNGDRGSGARGGAAEGTEALVFTAP